MQCGALGRCCVQNTDQNVNTIDLGRACEPRRLSTLLLCSMLVLACELESSPDDSQRQAPPPTVPTRVVPVEPVSLQPSIPNKPVEHASVAPPPQPPAAAMTPAPSAVEPQAAPDKASFSLFVYMVGSDLESGHGLGTEDLAEMQLVGSSDDVSVVVETGGANKADWKTVKRWLIGQDSRKELEDLGEQNMADPQTLEEFMRWGVQNFPAERYGLVLWDHGGGSVGAAYGFDENYDNQGLSLMQIQQALINGLGGNKLELLGFDACLMATVEAGYVMSDLASYLVASEEIVPGYGWNYQAVLSTLMANPSIAGSALGKRIADTYLAWGEAVDVVSGGNQASNLTLSVIELAQIAPVVDSLNALVERAVADLASLGRDSLIKLAQGRSRTEEFGTDRAERRYSDLADVKDLAGQLAAVYPQEAADLRAAVTAAVSYSVHGSAHPRANGLSIFFAFNMLDAWNLETQLSDYDALGFSPAYQQLVREFAIQVNSDDTPPVIDQEYYSAGLLTAQVEGGDITKVNAMITQSDPLTGSVLVLGSDQASLDAYGRASYRWTGELGTMNDSYVYSIVEVDDDATRVIVVPAMLNDEAVDIRFVVDKVTQQLTLMGVYPGYDSNSGIIERIVYDVVAGDIIAPLFPRYDLSTGDYTYVTWMEFTVGDEGLYFASKRLPAGDYQLALNAEDYAHNWGSSNYFPVEIPAN